MVLELVAIFVNVITPVFALVIIGRLIAPKLGLQARTPSRLAYYVLVPALIFDVFRAADIELGLALRMMGHGLVVHILLAVVAWGIGRLLNKPKEMIAAYILIATFGNVGNFGLPLIQFRLGDEALVAAAVYFFVILTIAFIIGVGAASSLRGGSPLDAIMSVAKTPALIAVVPAVLVNALNIELPLFLARIIGLLADATIPMMLLTLGIQLGEMKTFTFSTDVIIASTLRLIGGAILAIALAGTFGLTGIERGTGIIQSAMPAAVLCTLIALEHDLIPDFVTTTVLFSTLASVVTLTLLMAFV